MSAPEAQLPLPPAGWFDDPAGSAELRWWSGEVWTDHLTPRPSEGAEPEQHQPVIPMSSATTSIMWREPPPPPRFSPAGWSTPGVWVVASSPLLVLLVEALVVVVVGLVPESSPAIFALLVLPLAIVVAAAVRDRNRLYGMGYVKTATPTWLLLGPLGYLIARTVRVRHESSRGLAPLVFFLICGTVICVGVFAVSNALTGR